MPKAKTVQQPETAFDTKKARLLTVEQFSREHPGFSPSSLRWQIFHADQNGMVAAGALVRVPGTRKVLINEPAFLHWLGLPEAVA